MFGTDVQRNDDMPMSISRSAVNSSLKVISQARNRNHRRDRLSIIRRRELSCSPPMQVQHAAAVHLRGASMHLGVLALSTESSFFGEGGRMKGGGGNTDRLFIPRSDGHVRASVPKTAANWAQ